MESQLFIDAAMVMSLVLLVWSCIEVGSNDAANLVNAVFGSRVMSRQRAVFIAGLAVILGASFSSPVVDTVRKGIFDLASLDAKMAIAVFMASYLVGTVLLYTYSVFGMPVSTTATLVFSLAGGAVGVTQSLGCVYWPKLGQVSIAIFVSIFLSGLASFLAQRMFRGAIRRDSQKHDLVLLHGPWITGLILVALFWFMIVKGMKSLTITAEILSSPLFAQIGMGGLLLILWACFTLLTHLALVLTGERGTKYLFHVTAVLGMICMAFAFGQNDLANAASPGIGVYMIWRNGVTESGAMQVPILALSMCGALMFIGMMTKRAQRVTRAEMNTASQQDEVKLYAPQWCCRVAEFLISRMGSAKGDDIRAIAPASSRSAKGKKLHYDALRASVILAVGASIIAFASSLGLPVSTTYVAFAAVVATGWGDRVFARGSSALKLGRAIWVVTGWIMGAVISFFVCGMAALLIHRFEIFGILAALAVNLLIRRYYSRRAQAHEEAYHGKSRRRKGKKVVAA